MSNEKICYIAGAGDICGYKITPASHDFVIAADGGYAELEKQGIKADIVVGDFDSIGKEYVNAQNIITLPHEKDETDMLAAIQLGLEKDCNIFHIYGGWGGRFEHTFANIQCLVYLLENNAHGYLYGDGIIITAIQNESFEFNAKAKGYVSVFAYSGEARGVSITGLKYELDNTVLQNSYPLGVSNEFIGKGSRVSVQNGILILIYPTEKN